MNKNSIYKILLLIIIFTFFIYFITTSIIDYQFYKNKSKLENLILSYTKAKEVYFENFHNIPLHSLSLKRVYAYYNENNIIEIDNIIINYNFLNFIRHGLEKSITFIKINNISLKFNAFELSSIINNIIKENIKTNSNNTNTPIKIEDIQTKLFIKEFLIKIDILSPLSSDMKARNIILELNNNSIKTTNLFSMNIIYSNIINIFETDFELNLCLTNLINPFGKTEINILNLNLGGIKLPKKIKYIVELNTNFNFLVYNERYYNNPIIINNNYNFYLFISNDFSINYNRHNEYYLFDYIFNPGNYTIELLSKATNYLSKSTILIKSKDNKKDYLKFILSTSKNYFNINWELNSKKFGNGLINLYLSNNNYVSGFCDIDNILFMRGLRGSGKLFLNGKSNLITLNGNNIRINGGLIGKGYTTIKLDNDQIIFSSPENRRENALINGVINKYFYDINIKFQNVPGELIVSNIHIDALDISRGKFFGTCRICNSNSNIVNIFGNIYGYRIGNVYTGYSKQKYAIGELFLSNTTLYLSNISFPYHNLSFSGIMDFILTNLDITDININGKVFIFKKYFLPINGFIKVNELYSNMVSKILIDNKHTVDTISYFKSNFVCININAKDFNLSKIGLYGKINGNFYLRLTNLIINQILIDINYFITNRNFRIYAKGQRNELEKLVIISNFMLDNEDDKLFGKGYLYQENKRLIGEINFIRGGNIKFSSSFEDINANISIKNLIFKNLYKKNTEVFFNINASAYGPLIFPNFNGNLRVVNTINSEPFFLDIPLISRKWNELTFKSLKIINKDLNILLNININIDTNIIILKSDGVINLFDFLSFKNEIYYIKNNNISTITYNLENIYITNNYAGNLSGHVNIFDNKYLFYKKEKNGINGFLDIENNNLNWSIELDSLLINCSTSGELKNNNINSKISLNTRMDIFYFWNIFKRIEGNLKTDLRIHGRIDNPIIDGKIRINNLNLEVTNFNSRITNGNYTLALDNNKIIFNREIISTTTGNFIVNGYIDTSFILMPYFFLKIVPYDSKNNFISMNINTGFMEINGELIPQSLDIIGQLNNLKLSGKAIAQNALLSINFLALNNIRNKINYKQPAFLDSMIWDLNIIIGANIKFNSQFIEAMAVKGNNIIINGSFGNKTFSLKGEVGVNRGNITYLGRDYFINEGIIRFSGDQYDFIPYVNLTTRSRDKLVWKGSEKVDVYLIFEGKADKIIIKDFYSIPYINKEELSVFLGFQKKSESTNNIRTGLDTSDVIYTGMDTFIDLFFISPVSMTIRKSLGLDIFALRTVGLSSFTKKYLETGILDTDTIIEGTSIQIGKYLFPNLLLEGEIKLGKRLESLEDFSFYNYDLLYSLGLEFDILNINFWNINLNWKYQPIPEFRISPEYELKWELNIHKRF